MKNEKHIYVCKYFADEVKAIVNDFDINDIVVKEFPANCGRPELSSKYFSISNNPIDDSKKGIIGSVCISESLVRAQYPVADQYNNCFYMLLNKELIDYYISNGAYIITPGWLNNWRDEIKKMGFNEDTAAAFFKESCNKIMFLDTGIHEKSSTYLDECSSFIELPSVTLPVGLSHLKLNILNIIRTIEQKEVDLSNRKVTDYSMMIDLLNDLTESFNETEVISKIIDMFSMLFAPSKLYYLPINNSIQGSLISIPEVVDKEKIITRLNKIVTDSAFAFRLEHNSELLGIIEISELSFPQYTTHYKNLALSIIKICSLVIYNARTYQLVIDQRDELNAALDNLKETQEMLVESQKLAALGNLVAGVAHEINTPVGIGITATSGLLNKVTKLEELFFGGKLTKSNFEKSLVDFRDAGEIILRNLKLTGNLIKSFKLVSTDEVSERKREFNLEQYLNEVITSLIPQLKSKKVKTNISCSDEIIIDSYPGVFAQIISNLVINSLIHAFNNTSTPLISIDIKKKKNNITIQYSDNGSGISEEIIDKIFDPFYTTNKQLGSGLGLNIVYNLISQKLAGSITCQSKLTNGVNFTINMPVKPE